MCNRFLPRLVFGLCLAFGSVASAKDATTTPPGYTESINQALAELEAMNYPEALAEFRRAHEIFPNARTLRGLGMVEFELRHYAESKHLLEEALASTAKPLDEKLRKETQALLDRARRYVSDVFVQLTPSTGSLMVDGHPVQLSPGDRILLEVGEHVLEARAPGRATERRSLNIKGGERLDVQMTLESLALAETPVAASTGAHAEPTRAPVDTEERKPAYRKWWVWTSVAIVVAGGATAAAVLLTRDREGKTEPVRGTNATNVALQSLGSFR